MKLSAQSTSHFDLQHLTDTDIPALQILLQSAAEGATSRQMAAEHLVRRLFDCLKTTGDQPACVLVRCFHTATYARMPTHYQHAADGLLQSLPAPSQALPSDPQNLQQMRCLALLATHGSKSVWNDVLTSVGHQAIPLPSVEVVTKAPMIAKLFEQLGMAIERAVAPPDSPDLHVYASSGEFSIFHIEHAVGSPYIPAQSSFVEPYGVGSVLGMGGVLPEGELIAFILFARVPVSQAVAERFGRLAPIVRELMLRFPAAQTFQRLDRDL